MYWNNAGRYTDISPDIGDAKNGSAYPWEKAERDKSVRKPAVSGG